MTLWSAVVLSQGDRPDELDRALQSLLSQRDVSLEVIVVGNGWEPVGLPDGVRGLHLATNLGAPKGRNRGIRKARGELLYFLDDDAWLPDQGTLRAIEDAFDADPELCVVQTRIESPEGDSARRWVPRLWNKDPRHSSTVFSVLEGSVAARASTLKRTRGWPGRFFYAHEGIELAWRAWDTGGTVEYRGDLVAYHPLLTRERHAGHMFQDARNRVWLAKRNLPCPVAVAYIVNWTVLTGVRSVRQPTAYWQWLKGACTGVRTYGGRRRPISWKTVWGMTKAGRPPIV